MGVRIDMRAFEAEAFHRAVELSRSILGRLRRDGGEPGETVGMRAAGGAEPVIDQLR